VAARGGGKVAPAVSNLPADRAEVAPFFAEVAADRPEVAPTVAEVAADRAEVAPIVADLPPDRPEVAPTGAEVAADRAEVAADRPEVAPTGAEVAADCAEVAPIVADLPPDRPEVAPTGAEVAADRAEVAADRPEVAPTGAEVAADRAEVAADRPEVAPTVAEVAADRAEVAADRPEVAPTAADLPADRAAVAPSSAAPARDGPEVAPGPGTISTRTRGKNMEPANRFDPGWLAILKRILGPVYQEVGPVLALVDPAPLPNRPGVMALLRPMHAAVRRRLGAHAPATAAELEAYVAVGCLLLNYGFEAELQEVADTGVARGDLLARFQANHDAMFALPGVPVDAPPAKVLLEVSFQAQRAFHIIHTTLRGVSIEAGRRRARV
jgi:hypothetical protein